MNDETNNEVTTLEMLQNSLVVLTSETMKSNLTKTIEKLDNLEKESKLSSNSVIHAYKELMKKIDHLNNLIAALETINNFIRDKDGISMVFETIQKRQ